MARLSSHFPVVDGRLGSMAFPLTVVANISTVGNVTYTVPQIMGGFINRTGTLTANITDTMPSANAMVEAIQGCMVGTSFEIPFRNATTGAFTMTIAPGAGGTMSPSPQTVTQANTKFYQVVFTNVTIGQEAYTMYSLGGGTT